MMKNSVTIDAHQHFLDPKQFYYPWLTSKLAAINHYFGPEQLEPLLKQQGINKTICVQALACKDETKMLCAVANETNFVAGVVAWLDLTAINMADNLQQILNYPGGHKIVGIRHQANELEPSPAWFARQDVHHGLTILAKQNLTFDLLIDSTWLPAAIELVNAFPQLQFVIDHIANPKIAQGEFKAWADAMAMISRSSNVACKLSGMLELCQHETWQAEQLIPYVQTVLTCFGEDRLLFGSNWPVCLQVASYQQVYEALMTALGPISLTAKQKIFGLNAENFYLKKYFKEES